MYDYSPHEDYNHIFCKGLENEAVHYKSEELMNSIPPPISISFSSAYMLMKVDL